MTTGRGRGELALGIGAAVTGVTGALFVIVARRSLGPEAFLPIATLWTVWALSAAVLNFALQQTLVQAGAVSWRDINRVVRGAPTRVIVAVSVFVVLFTGVLGTRVFGSTNWTWPLMAGVVVPLAGAVATARGVLASARRFELLGLLIAAENTIRLGLGCLVALTIDTQHGFAVALLFGFLSPLLALPTIRGSVDRHRATFEGRQVLGASAIVGLASHSVFVATPLLLAIRNVEPVVVTSLFLLLTAARVPHVGLQALVPRAVVAFTEWEERGDVRRLRRGAAGILAVGIAASVAGFGLGYLIGRPLVGPMLAITDATRPVDFAFAGTATAAAVTATLMSSLLVCLRGERRAAGLWAAASLTLAVVILVFAPRNLTVVTGLVALTELVALLGSGCFAWIAAGQRRSPDR